MLSEIYSIHRRHREDLRFLTGSQGFIFLLFGFGSNKAGSSRPCFISLFRGTIGGEIDVSGGENESRACCVPSPPPPFVENNRYTEDNKKTWIEIREIDELTDRSHECLFSVPLPDIYVHTRRLNIVQCEGRRSKITTN